MLELGADSLKEHSAIVELALSLNAEKVLFVGGEFKAAVAQLDKDGGFDGRRVSLFEDSVALRDWLVQNGLQGATILIKGSRGTRLERIFDVL